MDNEITVPGGSPSPSGINKNEPARRVISGVRDFFARVTAPFAGMGHLWMAFILPVLIMALIYVAMEVWPFGKSSVLVLDLNGQYVYYFEALRDILHGEQGILYSFERALGGEFLGIFAYYLASPFSFIVALFPEGMITEALYVILLLKCGLSGMNMCFYLHKSHPVSKISEVIFSVMYALTSYAVVMQHNTMWIDCLLFLPLIFLGVESLIKYKKFRLYTITLTVAVLSNYYIGYMVCIATAAYFFFYYCLCTSSERNPLGERAHFIKTLGRMAVFSALAVGMASIMILPAYYSLTFGKTTFSNPNFSFAQKFDFLDLLSKMFPGSYDTVRPEGWPFVFSGTLMMMDFDAFSDEPVAVRRRSGKPGKNDILTESDAFNKLFRIDAKDAVSALRILTPPVLEGFINASEKLKCPLEAAFRNDKLYITLANGDTLEANETGTRTINEQRERIKTEMQDILSVVDNIYISAIIKNRAKPSGADGAGKSDQ